jgi:plastocyanin
MEPTSSTPNQPQPVLPPQLGVVSKRRQWARRVGFLIVLVLIAAVSTYLALHSEPISARPAVNAQIEITAARISPVTLRIKAGQSVMWVNQDSEPHQIASDPYPAEDTLPALNSLEPLATGESYTYVFERSGSYTYHDHSHPLAFKGTIIVE